MPGNDVPSLEEIPREECLALIAAAPVGRFAVSDPGGSPLVVPVNFILDGEIVVFRSDPGGKIIGLRHRPVSFQVDSIDPFHRTGWSVLIQGLAYEATRAEVEHLDLTPWVGEREFWVRLVPRSVTGRRIRLPEVGAEERGYL